MTKKQMRRYLRRAAQLIDERGWTKGTWARTANEDKSFTHTDIMKLVKAGDTDQLCSFCATGALAYAVAEDNPTADLNVLITKLQTLSLRFKETQHIDAMVFNDNLPYADEAAPLKVRAALLDTAAAL